MVIYYKPANWCYFIIFTSGYSQNYSILIFFDFYIERCASIHILHIVSLRCGYSQQQDFRCMWWQLWIHCKEGSIVFWNLEGRILRYHQHLKKKVEDIKLQSNVQFISSQSCCYYSNSLYSTYNSFFYICILFSFVARMELHLERGNIDRSLHWKRTNLLWFYSKYRL